mgnify:CR=1 FL=1
MAAPPPPGGSGLVAAVVAASEKLVAVLPPPRGGLPRPLEFESAADNFLVAWRELRTSVEAEALSALDRVMLSR